MILIAHNVRSAHNVGSLLRTADGLGLEKVYLTGYTPYPAHDDDERLPHLAAKINRSIAKTSLGAEKSMDWEHSENLEELIDNLHAEGCKVIALEQSPRSVNLSDYKPPKKAALIVGNEVDGIDSSVLSLVDDIVEIPMQGQKESFNVAIAAAIALYVLLNN